MKIIQFWAENCLTTRKMALGWFLWAIHFLKRKHLPKLISWIILDYSSALKNTRKTNFPDNWVFVDQPHIPCLPCLPCPWAFILTIISQNSSMVRSPVWFPSSAAGWGKPVVGTLSSAARQLGREAIALRDTSGKIIDHKAEGTLHMFAACIHMCIWTCISVCNCTNMLCFSSPCLAYLGIVLDYWIYYEGCEMMPCWGHLLRTWSMIDPRSRTKVT